MARCRSGYVARWAGQRFGANYASPYHGEHVTLYESLEMAKRDLSEDVFGCAGDSVALWRVDAHDSEAEAIGRTNTDLAEADRLLTLGPRGGVKVEAL